MTLKNRFISLPVLTVLTYSLITGVSFAASVSAGINVSVSVPSTSTLTLGATNLTFVADDPTLQTAVPAQENPVSVLARVRSKGTPSLTVLASDDLKDGSNVIPVSAVNWTADGAPYIAGVMNKTSAQPAASFPAGSGSYFSSFRFTLANSMQYLPGTYATIITYTLTGP